MVIRGRIKNGGIVLDDDLVLPEGTEVTIFVQTTQETTADKLCAERKQRLHDARKRLESLPNENPGDRFSGAEHDRVLYGDD